MSNRGKGRKGRTDTTEQHDNTSVMNAIRLVNELIEQEENDAQRQASLLVREELN